MIRAKLCLFFLDLFVFPTYNKNEFIQILSTNVKVEGAIRLKRGLLVSKGTPKPPDSRAHNGRKPKSHIRENEHEQKEK
jgi:hypothetical protein